MPTRYGERMAQGRTWRARLLVILAMSLYAFLLAAGFVPNPFPAMWEWVIQDRPLADGLVWQERIGAKPASVTVAGSRLAVDAGRSSEVRRQSDGELAFPLSSGEHRADWVAVAGSGDDSVVVTGRRLRRGYQVRDAATGAILHTDEAAAAVWTYRNALLDLRCDGPRSCELRRYRPGSDTPDWSADIAGAGAVISGPNPDLAGGRAETPRNIDSGLSGPGQVPRVIGLPTGRREVVVVETGTGRVLHELRAARDEKIMVIGDRILRSVATNREGVCVVSVTGLDAVAGTPVWGPHPYHLRTVSGPGCGQEHAPVTAGGAVAAIGPDGRELVLDAYDGRVLWRGEEGERVAALSAEHAVIEGTDPTVRYGVALGSSGGRLWEADVHEQAGLALAECGVVVADRGPNRLRVWDPETGQQRLSVRTSARAIACTPAGLVITGGRSIGLAAWEDGHDVEAVSGQK